MDWPISGAVFAATREVVDLVKRLGITAMAAAATPSTAVAIGFGPVATSNAGSNSVASGLFVAPAALEVGTFTFTLGCGLGATVCDAALTVSDRLGTATYCGTATIDVATNGVGIVVGNTSTWTVSPAPPSPNFSCPHGTFGGTVQITTMFGVDLTAGVATFWQ